MEAYEYLEYLENSPGSTYRQVAEKFNISKARVSQMIALVKRLPQEIIDFLINNDNLEGFCYSTERKLWQLTLMESDEAKIEKFKGMLASN